MAGLGAADCEGASTVREGVCEGERGCHEDWKRGPLYKPLLRRRKLDALLDSYSRVCHSQARSLCKKRCIKWGRVELQLRHRGCRCRNLEALLLWDFRLFRQDAVGMHLILEIVDRIIFIISSPLDRGDGTRCPDSRGEETPRR